jgi:MFS family permease
MTVSIRNLLLKSALIWYFGEGLLGPLLVIFSQKVGGDILNISWAFAVFLLVSGICTIVVGYLSDIFSKEKICVLGFYLNAMFTFSYLYVDSIYSLLLVQAGIGLATALANPTWDALYSEYQDHSKEGWGWGIEEGLKNVVLSIALLIGGFAITTFSFNTVFIIMGCIQVIAAIYQTRILFHINSKKN